jgi:PTH1 family peptidyl-tRNA hydrolase
MDTGAQTSGEDRYLIVGLGNPGRGHLYNRHNAGFMVADRLAARHSIDLRRVQSKAIVGSGRIAGRPVTIAKPQTFMNLSGEAVGALANFYKIPSGRLLVIYDELDIPFGAIRLREKGGAGGHNGMRSIIQRLGNDFPRLRLGIGRPPGRMDPAAYVLQNFAGDELPLVSDMLAAAVEAVESFIADGIDIAMSRFNGPVANPANPQPNEP